MVGRRRGAEERREFEQFAHERGAALFRTALLLCGDWHLAEDLTQTALARIYASWHRVAQAESPAAYARTVLVRCYLSHRRLRRSTELPVLDGLPEQAAPDHDPALRVALLAALAELPPKDRAVLVLRYWEDRSVDETAAELQLSPGTVRVRSLRALTRLRRQLAPHLDSLVP
ncbi:RNA polymerase sigma24 factor [Kitasatospora phosalacinea]|uniref:RNA polymerase sigma24 factor n=1 Tax=Kitasatospora phosalacinea TaxID=2065 RepID=A0A9W6QBS8_9ACTN|nr:RNA polymerase sigma24 factor [Kitasatospora phosalacinea]